VIQILLGWWKKVNQWIWINQSRKHIACKAEQRKQYQIGVNAIVVGSLPTHSSVGSWNAHHNFDDLTLLVRYHQDTNVRQTDRQTGREREKDTERERNEENVLNVHPRKVVTQPNNIATNKDEAFSTDVQNITKLVETLPALLQTIFTAHNHYLHCCRRYLLHTIMYFMCVQSMCMYYLRMFCILFHTHHIIVKVKADKFVTVKKNFSNIFNEYLCGLNLVTDITLGWKDIFVECDKETWSVTDCIHVWTPDGTCRKQSVKFPICA